MSDEDAALPPNPSPTPPRSTRAVARQGTSAVAFEDEEIDADDPLLDFEPFIHAAPRANSITPDIQRRFVAELRACGVVKQAARKVGKSLEALYKLRERPGAEGFAAAWDAARERFGARLHDFASARVMEGDERPIVSQGRILGWHTVYDYPTIRFMLRHNLPERYSPAAEALKPGHPAYDKLADAMLAVYNRKLRQARADVTPQAMAIHTHRRLRDWRHCEKLAAMGRDPDTAWDYDAGYFWDEVVSRVGYTGDKVLAMESLFDPTTYFMFMQTRLLLTGLIYQVSNKITRW